MPVRRSLYSEVGSTGLVQYSGHVQEEFLNDLKGTRWRRVVREMTNNDPIVGAMLFAIEYLCRQVRWEVKPAGDGKAAEDKESAEFIKTCLFEDMSQAWSDLLAEILSFVPWGWAYFEIVYKTREGDQMQPGKASKFNDSRIGWRKWAIRAQESLYKWDFDAEGGVQAMVQQAEPSCQTVPIPIEKSLLFRTSIAKNNPEGRSLLRNAYRPWYFKKNIENLEGIGIERNLAGVPTMKAPARILDPNASSEDKAIREHCEKALNDLRANEMGWLLYPSDPYPETQIPQYDFKLTSAASGNKVMDTRSVITGKNQEILLCTMTDLLMIGGQKVGSYALVDKKADLLTEALASFLDSVAAIINRHASPRLLRLNGMPAASVPTVTHGRIQKLSFKELAEIMGSVQQVLNPREIAWLLSEASFPPRSEDEIKKDEERREKMQDQLTQGPRENKPQDSDTNSDE